MKTITTAVAAAMALTACSVVTEAGKGVDRTCVRGKLTAADAQALAANHPSWGISEDDRIVNRDCSQLLRGVTDRDS
ncbi:MAG: hypothetical protein E6Q98_16155 [Rhodospirillaceae bacterium]|nr:MAG: hypothetical protein E6Q98_16155 [Rhodospirillaceae bacterium]